MKYLHFDARGELCARYDSDFHGSEIPENALPVDDRTFARTIVEIDGIWALSGGVVTKLPFPPPTADQIMRETVSLARALMDDTAARFGFANMSDAVSYADESAVPELQRIALQLRAWRSTVLDTSLRFAEERASQNGKVPSLADLNQAIPAFISD